MTAFNLVPEQSPGPPPSRKRMVWQGLLALAALALGWLLAQHLDTGGGGRIAATLAALLLIGGLCGAIVTLIQCTVARR
jgi:Zn-dependent protease with chaperone function